MVTKTQIGIFIGGIIAMLLVLGGGWYLLSQENNKTAEMLLTAQEKQEEALQKAQNNSQIVAPTEDTSDWKTYRNEKYGFEIMYPDSWDLRTSEIYGAESFSFTSNKSRITILPRGEFDHGAVPEGEIIDSKLAGENIKIQGNEAYFFYYLVDDASNWIKCSESLKNCNRIEVYISDGDEQLVNQILSTFKFIDIAKQTPFTKIREEDELIYYSGTATLSGKYSFYPEGILGNSLCFEADSTSAYIIPRENGDARKPWFCFEDQEIISNLFVPDAFAQQNGNCEEIGGTATITISNYVADTRETATADSAHLDKIISAELPKCL